MATVHATILEVRGKFPSGEFAPVADSEVVAAQAITSSGTHEVSTISVPTTPGNLIWRIVSTGAVWVKFGLAPEATTGTDHYLPAGVPMEWHARPGHKVSVEDVA
jgi:hypothetical protein